MHRNAVKCLSWRAVSSVVEHFVHTEGVTGSNPVPPTILLAETARVADAPQTRCANQTDYLLPLVVSPAILAWLAIDFWKIAFCSGVHLAASALASALDCGVSTAVLSSADPQPATTKTATAIKTEYRRINPATRSPQTPPEPLPRFGK